MSAMLDEGGLAPKELEHVSRAIARLGRPHRRPAGACRKEVSAGRFRFRDLWEHWRRFQNVTVVNIFCAIRANMFHRDDDRTGPNRYVFAVGNLGQTGDAGGA